MLAAGDSAHLGDKSEWLKGEDAKAREMVWGLGVEGLGPRLIFSEH